MQTQMDTQQLDKSAQARGLRSGGRGATPVKQIVTIRLDTDMLAWFKAEGPGYQTRMNQVLREYMENNPRLDTAPAQDPA